MLRHADLQVRCSSHILKGCLGAEFISALTQINVRRTWIFTLTTGAPPPGGGGSDEEALNQMSISIRTDRKGILTRYFLFYHMTVLSAKVSHSLIAVSSVGATVNHRDSEL